MKSRQGFVSNSSSSSFICDVCGSLRIWGDGGDCSFSDDEIFRCETGHSVCMDHLSDEDRKILDEKMEDEDFSLHDVPKELCPLCKREEAPFHNVFCYLVQKTGKKYNEVAKEYLEAMDAKREKKMLEDTKDVPYVMD